MKNRASVALLFAVLASSCSHAPTAEKSSHTAPASGDWAIVRVEADPGVLNPIISTSATANYIALGALGSMISEQLLRYDAQTGNPTIPGLATAYPEISADHLVYTFTIRDGVKWHDGRPFSAEDVLFTIKAGMLPSVDSAAFRSSFSSLAGAQIIKRNQIQFRVKEPYWLNDAALAANIVPVPRHIYDPEGVLDRYKLEDILNPKAATDPVLMKFGEGFNKNPANRAPLGTGPYKLATWQEGQEIVLVRNEDYWGQKPYLDKVVYRIIPDAATALAALKSGDVDFVPRLQPIQFEEQTGGPAFQKAFVKTSYQIPQVAYLGWNEDRAYFSDKRVRQALTMLIDRQKLIEVVRHGLGSLAPSVFASDSPDFNSALKPLPYDPKSAAQLLDEAGWIDHNGNGIRDKNGVEFKFEVLASSANAAAVPVLAVLEDELGKAGISVTVRRLEPAVFVSTLRDHKADAAIGGWTSALQFDPYQLFHSSAALNRNSNYFNFRNREADDVMERARVEFDPSKRKQLYGRFQEIFADEQPCTLLYYPVDAAAYHNRFQNIQFLHQRPGYEITQWWVSPSVQRFTAAK